MNESRQLFLGNLAYAATVLDVERALTSLGLTIAAVRLGLDRETGASRGFAFVDLSTDEPLNIDQAVALVDGLMIVGRPCRAAEAKPRSVETRGRKPERVSAPAPAPRGGKGRARSDRQRFEDPWND